MQNLSEADCFIENIDYCTKIFGREMLRHLEKVQLFVVNCQSSGRAEAFPYKAIILNTRMCKIFG